MMRLTRNLICFILLISIAICNQLSAKISFFNLELNNDASTFDTTLPDISKVKNDSVLAAIILTHMNKYAAIDGNTYYGYGLFYPADSSFKIVNVFGEYTGGATYNPFAKPFIIWNKKILRSELYGEVFRADKISDEHYLFYCDDYSRMGSAISIYDVFFEGDSLRFLDAKQHGNYIYNLIVNKKEQLNDQPRPKFTSRFTENELSRLNLDTNAIQVNEYYQISDEKFLSTELQEPAVLVYYRYNYGDQLEKILRVENNNAYQDITLAMYGGDSNDYTLISEFVNDSLFKQTFVNTETIIDEEYLMGYGVDSTVSYFQYDEQLKFVEIHKDSFHYETTDTMILGSYRPYKTCQYSKPYLVNGLKCVWVYNLTYKYDASGNPLGMEFRSELLNEERNVILKANDDFVNQNPLKFINERENNFKDLNFDGFNDCMILNQISSGNGGDFYDAYLFNPLSKSFDFSEMLSGGNLEINDSLKTVSFFLKAGFYNRGSTIIHFGANGKVLFTEDFSEKDLPGEPLKIQYTYKKIVNGKVVKTKTSISLVEENK
ncbi:hypothetical protein BH11BAC2_BH11BAC2_10910 [soil metagenome]